MAVQVWALSLLVARRSVAVAFVLLAARWGAMRPWWRPGCCLPAPGQSLPPLPLEQKHTSNPRVNASTTYTYNMLAPGLSPSDFF